MPLGVLSFVVVDVQLYGARVGDAVTIRQGKHVVGERANILSVQRVGEVRPASDMGPKLLGMGIHRFGVNATYTCGVDGW